MKEKLISRLYDYFSCTDEELNKSLLENINDIVNNQGRKGAEELLDWCRNEFDRAREIYINEHNIDEDEMENIMKKNCGDYQFMYNDYPFVEDLDKIWDICNWYLDYYDDDKTENYRILLEDMLDNFI